LPYVNRVARYPPDPGASPREFSFHIYQQALAKRTDYPNPFLYFATLDKPDDREDDQLVVKFTRRYCPELHFFCAEQGLAPKLLGFGMIPGGWHVVVMEKILQRHKPFGRDRFQMWSQDLKYLVKAFHDRGWVHGDLRDANVLFNLEKSEHIMLVDFDWGGKVDDGPVYYPTALLNEELEKPGDLDDLRITKERDDHVLALTLDNLEKLITEVP
jgi:serine/threonine protein kinase